MENLAFGIVIAVSIGTGGDSSDSAGTVGTDPVKLLKIKDLTIVAFVS